MTRRSTSISASALALGLLVAGGAAQATSFDFGSAGIGNEQGNPNEMDATPIGLRFDGSGSVFTDGFSGSGIQVIATGQGPGNASAPFAYLDSQFQGRTAGLGVCSTLSGTECTPSRDDNIGIESTGAADEQLTLTTNEDVTWSDLSFKGQLHYGVDATDTNGQAELDGDETFLLNGVSTTFADAESAVTGPGTDFTFGYGGDNPEQFYVSGGTATGGTPTAVPAPAGAGLFGLALIGLGALVRRRRS